MLLSVVKWVSKKQSCSLCLSAVVEVVIHFGAVVAAAGGWGVEQHLQQIGFDVANVRGALPQAVQHILDVGGIQLQKPLLHQCRIKLLSADPHEAALCAEDLQHEVRDLVDVVIGMLPAQVVILDVLPNLFSVSLNHLLRLRARMDR